MSNIRCAETHILSHPIIVPENKSINMPIYGSTIFQMPSYEKALFCEKAMRPFDYYGRWGNPNSQYLSTMLSSLRNYDIGLLMPSGMSAITTTIFGLVESGDVILSSRNLYGDTIQFFHTQMPRLSVTVKWFDPVTLEGLINYECKKSPKIVFFESLSNPDLKFANIQGIIEWCKIHKSITICDATFTPPSILNKNWPNTDIEIHSLTKYISGDYANTGGAVLTREDLGNKIWKLQSMLGACMDARTANQIAMNCSTLHTRIQAQSKSASAIAEYLNNNSRISNTIYPSLSNYSYRNLSHPYLNNSGAIISFILEGSQGEIKSILENFLIIRLSVSVGGVKSVIEHAEFMSHSMVEDQTFKPIKNLIRVSIGLENTDDLLEDFDQALMIKS